jgi:hypothetical protein
MRQPDQVNEHLEQLLNSLISARMVQHTNRVCEAIGINPDLIRYKRNSRYLVADRMYKTAFEKELERIGWA